MKNRKIILTVMFVSMCLLWTGCKKKAKETANVTEIPTAEATPSPTIQPTPTEEVTPTIMPEVTPGAGDKAAWFDLQMEQLIKDNPKYNKGYTQEVYDFDDVYAVVFQPDDAIKDFMEYYCDIWVVGENLCTQVIEDAYVNYESFCKGLLDGKEYFRYDISYPTESLTELLMIDEEGQVREVSLPGWLQQIDGTDLVITKSSYDMVYVIGDEYSCGHTWKPYYYKYSNYEITPYTRTEIDQETFLTYSGAAERLEAIQKTYKTPDVNVVYSFQSVDNGMITVNIGVESDTDITYYYETYLIQANDSLGLVSLGEGSYAGLIGIEESKAYVLDYSEEKNTIKVQIIEWLSPWDAEDALRLQELIDEKKIEDSADAMSGEFYLYADKDNVKTYLLDDDVTIRLWGDSYTGPMEKDVLKEDMSGRLMSIKVRDNVVLSINEEYMP